MSEQRLGLEQHRYLPPVTPPGGRNAEVRDALALRLSVRSQNIYLGLNPDTVIGRILQATTREGDRIGVALPSAPEFIRQSLAVGAAYVDFGCDFLFVPRQDRLDRLLADGVLSAILIATPNPVTGVGWQPQGTGAVLVVEDRRAARSYGPMPVSPHRVTVGQIGAVLFVVAEPHVIDRLNRLAPEPRLSDREHTTALSAPEETIDTPYAWSAASEFGFIASRSNQPWALVRHPALSGADLSQACQKAHITASPGTVNPPTWRDSVRLLWPERDGFKRLAVILGLTSLIWAACGSPASKGVHAPSSEAAPSLTQPAPAARPAPPKTKPQDTASKVSPKASINRAPVVGGCGALCGDARAALSGFAAALKASDRHSRLPQYIDSSRLVLDDERVGDALSTMWLRGEMSPRLQKIGDIVDELSDAVKSSDEAALLALAEQAPFSLQQPRKVVASLALPGLPRPWTVTLGRRGLEWLVVAIAR